MDIGRGGGRRGGPHDSKQMEFYHSVQQCSNVANFSELVGSGCAIGMDGRIKRSGSSGRDGVRTVTVRIAHFRTYMICMCVQCVCVCVDVFETMQQKDFRTYMICMCMCMDGFWN